MTRPPSLPQSPNKADWRLRGAEPGLLLALLLATLLLFASACHRGPSAAEQLAEASRRVSFGTLAQLGPHRLAATVTRGEPEGADVDTETLELDWGDLDNFQVRRVRNGRVRSELRVLRGEAWVRVGTSPFNHYDDAELYRVELASTWNVFDTALSPFQGRIQLLDGQETVVEGRPAMRYTVALAPGEAPARGHVPQSLSGEVVLDQATAMRLVARVEGSYLESGRADRLRTIQVELTRSQLGLLPPIEAPQRERKRRKPDTVP